jgi:predicted ribosome quality control (RQC) complex YloA/Tae2 family protein
MPRVHFVKAAKDHPEAGIRKGEMYYWWKFRYGAKVYSKTQPKRQQLTQSEFMQAVYDFDERIAALTATDDLESEVESVADDMETCASEQEDKLSNMPDGLQEGEVGQMLQERADAMNGWAEELRGVDFDVEEKDEAEAHKEAMFDLGFDPLPTDAEGKPIPLTPEQEAQVKERADELTAEARDERLQEILEEVQGTSYGGP